MAESYGEMIAELVDDICKYDERPDVFRRNCIPKGHFYNVINPNKKTSAGRQFYAPIEWMVSLTKDASNYSMLKQVAKDCRCIVLTPDDLDGFEDADPEKTLELFQQIIGAAKGK